MTKTFAIATADIVGTCPECGQPTTGHLDTDEDLCRMECVSCHHAVVYAVESPVLIKLVPWKP